MRRIVQVKRDAMERAFDACVQRKALENSTRWDGRQRSYGGRFLRPDRRGSTRLLRCPDPNGGSYVYVPGLREQSPPTSVLVYEPNAVHDGRCNVLLLNGQIVGLTSEQLRQALAATHAGR